MLFVRMLICVEKLIPQALNQIVRDQPFRILPLRCRRHGRNDMVEEDIVLVVIDDEDGLAPDFGFCCQSFQDGVHVGKHHHLVKLQGAQNICMEQRSTRPEINGPPSRPYETPPACGPSLLCELMENLAMLPPRPDIVRRTPESCPCSCRLECRVRLFHPDTASS